MRPIPIKQELIVPYSDPRASPRARRFFRNWMSQEYQHLAVCGGRGCGKSVSVWCLLLWLVEEVPGIKICVLRQEARTIKRTIYRTFKDRILAYPTKDPRNPFNVYGGDNAPDHIDFDNGSLIDFVGFDDESKLQGGEYDVVFFNEIGRELNHEKVSDLMATLAGGRGGNLKINGEPRLLFIGDLNPTSPHHWYYKLGKTPKVRWYGFRHSDNPQYYNHVTEKWKKRGTKAWSDLHDAYPPGHSRDRMVYGKCVGAEGMVFDMYSPERHEIRMSRSDEFFSDCLWDLSMDFGGDNPHAVGLFAQNVDRYRLFKEIYVSHITISRLIEHVMNMLAAENLSLSDIGACIVDHNTEHRLQLEEAGFPVVLASKEVIAGIDCMKRVLADNRFQVNTGSLIDIYDEYLVNKIKGFKQEVMSLRYKDADAKRHDASDEHPAPRQPNHTTDLVRYYLKYKEESFEFPAVMEPVGSASFGGMILGG